MFHEQWTRLMSLVPTYRIVALTVVPASCSCAPPQIGEMSAWVRHMPPSLRSTWMTIDTVDDIT